MISGSHQIGYRWDANVDRALRDFCFDLADGCLQLQLFASNFGARKRWDN